jgi:hypothetical protein
VTPEELLELDDLVVAALGAGHEADLAVLGYGEVSLVLGWPPPDPRWACKRLPAFPSRERFEAYRRLLGEYLDTLRHAGIEPVATELMAVDRGEGAVVGYAVQPVLAPETLAPAVLLRTDPERGHPLVGAIVDAAARAVTPRVGLDAQLANWAWDDGTLTYLDVTTPLLWSAEGRPLLDVDLLLRPLPALLRPAVRRFVVPGILDTYRDLRKVAFDLCGNLIKQRLDGWLPAFLAAVNRRIDPPMTEQDVRRYYRSDARLWGVLLRIRRLDRAWQRHVRRRSYPFLLPQRIER